LRYRLRFGDGEIEFSLPTKAQVLLPRKTKPLANPETAIRELLDKPIGCPPFAEVMRTRGTVAIVVNDETRVARTEVFLPILLDALNGVGVEDRRIFAVIANGTHRPMTTAEIRNKLGPAASQRIRVYNHHAKTGKMVHVGTTRAGTAVAYNKRVMDADRIVLTGSIIYHFFAGYGGGRKALFPGVAAYGSIERNHLLTLDPRSTFGRLAGNPVDEDIQEAVAFRRPDFLLNTVLDEDKRIVGVVAGEYRQAHAAGCRIVDRVYGSPVPEPADLVIASCGGYPKDINVFQSHKTMENAIRVTRKGGVAIIVAECRDGIGPSNFVAWLRRYEHAADMEAQLRRRFEFGAHKAYFLARLTEKADVLLVSAIPARSLQGLFVQPVASMEEALKRAHAKLGPNPRTYVLPQGGLVFPWVEAER
jgi:lactate racemase